MKKLWALCLLSLLSVAASPMLDGATSGEHKARTPDGIELWYRVAGVSRGLPVVFVHGGPGEGSQAMQALAGPALEKRVHMVYFDQRGSGQSERPKDRKLYSLALLESDIETVRRAIGADRIIVLAHSAGTPIALEYAADHPEHVAGLILTGAVPDMPALIQNLCERVKTVHPELYAKAVAGPPPVDGARCNPFAPFSDEQRQAFFDANMFPDDAVRDRVNWLDHIPGVANSGQVGGALFGQGFAEYRFSRPVRLTMPLLFISGGRDMQTPMGPQRALAAKVRDGRVIVYPNAGHFMFADSPDRFAADVAAFVQRASRLKKL